MDCLFCRIVKGTLSARILHDDDRALAFEDINPQAPVHVLVIPKKHIATPQDITAEDASLVGHLFTVAGGVAARKGIARSGYRLVMNCNLDAGQTVFHIHLHLLGGRPMHWPPG